MNTAHQRGAALVLLLCLAVSCIASAAPTFTDQDVDNGYVNPRDTIVVQKVKIVDGSSTINSVWLRNLGEADERDIVRIVVDDDADSFTGPLAEFTTLTGLRTGLTRSLAYAVPNGTSYLWIGVQIAAAGQVAGGERIQLQLRFYSGAYTSDLVTDGSAETIFKGAFEKVVDNALSAGYLNPGDANVRVQQATFTDDDGNNSGVGITKVSVSNTGDADETDITDVKVEIIVGATTYTANKAPTAADWGSGNPLEFTAAEFGLPALFADDVGVVVRVRVTVGGTTDKHEIKTQLVLRTQENGEAYDQPILASRTQTIRLQGLEAVRDASSDIPSGVLGPGEKLVQEVTVTDDDVNGANVTITGIWIKNEGDATSDDLLKIVVKRGIITLFTLLAADIVDFSSGHRYIGGNGFTPTVLTDDDSATLSIEYTIDGTITDGHTLQPEVYFWANENVANYESDKVTYPKSIVLHPLGLEAVSNVSPPSGGTAYSGQQVLVQKVACEDLDENTDSVRINPVRITNVAETDKCTPSEITRIEVRTEEDDRLLGQTTDVAGLNTGGVAISTLQNNVVADNSEVALCIYVTFAGPEAVTAGHTLKVETTIFSEEDGHVGENTVRGAEWTLAINHRPVPDFSFAKATVAPASIGPKADFAAADTIQFSGTATDPDGDAIASWHWDFGDGNTSDVQNPTHQYPNGGTFTVTLTVTDARGVTGSVSKTIEVEGPPNVAPVIDAINADPESPAKDQDVAFSADITDPDQPAGTAFTYAWDFGDGTTSVLAAPTHAFSNKQTYTVTLTVTDAQGATATATKAISVGNEKPVASFTPSTTTPSTGDAVQFTDTSTDPGDDPADTPFTYAWDFGGGVTSTAQNPTHTYTTPGTYAVTLIVTDSRGGVSDPTTADITVAGPARTVLFAFPNPAATVATFTYFLVEGATDPILRIYDVIGRLVVEQELPAGGTTFNRDLRTAGGAALPNGLYFCVVTVTGANPSEIFRLLIVR